MAVVGKWQVEAVQHDWQGRPVTQMKGVAMNPPLLADLENSSFLATVSKIFYDGHLQSEHRSFFDQDTKTFTGTKYRYDQWGRLRGRSSFDGSGKSFRPFSVQDYDWRGYTVATATFLAEPNWAQVIENAEFAANTSQGRKSLSKTYVNSRGNIYKTETFEMAADGKAGKSATNNSFFDVKGRTVATENVNGLRNENEFDTLGRLVATKTRTGDVVVTKTENVFDTKGRRIESHQYELNAGETKSISEDAKNFVRRSTFSWYDHVGRPVTQADFGSGGKVWQYNAKPTRPENAPTESSEECLVTKTSYDKNTGRQDILTDAAGRQSKTVYDSLGRTISQFQNFVNGKSQTADEDVETRFSYDGLDNIVTLVAVNPTTGNQVTRYLYEDAFDVTLQTSALYPDSADTDSKGTDQVKTAYFLDGNVKSVTDQNGTTRTFAYDSQRRQISDTVTKLGNGVDGKVQRVAKPTIGTGHWPVSLFMIRKMRC